MKKTVIGKKFINATTKKPTNTVQITPILQPDRDYNCWWCTLSASNPVGCPIKYLPVYDKKDRQREKVIEKKYVTQGIFCCFNCAKAYALAKSHDATYRNSVKLIADMSDNPRIQPAPDMMLLSQYGGDMREEQYRASFDRILYINDGTLEMFPVTTIFIEKENM